MANTLAYCAKAVTTEQISFIVSGLLGFSFWQKRELAKMRDTVQ